MPVPSGAGHKVYRVDGVALLPLGAAAGVSQQQDTPEERRYRCGRAYLGTHACVYVEASVLDVEERAGLG